MSWLDNYLDAQLGSAAFYVKRATLEGGRRVVKHKFPGSAKIEKEDLGPEDDIFTLDCYVLGDDYMLQRDSFEDSLTAGGPQKLIHPYRGTKTILVEKWKEIEATEEGRMARFLITVSLFEAAQATTLKSNRFDILNAKKSLLESVQEWFEDVYDLARKPIQAIDDARETLDAVSDVIASAKAVVGVSAEFNRALDNFKGKIIAISLNAQDLASSLLDLVNFGTDPETSVDIGANSDNAKLQIREQRQIINEATEEQLVQTIPEIATDPEYPSAQIQKLTKYAAVAANTGLMATTEFDSVQDAEDAQNTLFSYYDELSLDPAIPDSIFTALMDAKEAVFRDIQERSVRLPVLVDKELPSMETSITLCYDLYGNLENEQDIIKRNGIIHPGFIPSGTVQVKSEND